MSKIKIDTSKGIMIAELYDKETPIAAENFLKLTKQAFYDDLIFHRVIAEKQYHDRGVLSMAHAGRNTGGSQFFICHSRQGTAHLDGNHTCFGKIVEGLGVIDKIQQGDIINTISIL